MFGYIFHPFEDGIANAISSFIITTITTTSP